MTDFKSICITDENCIYVFFEIINQIEPESVLDVGMFLKRIGAVSRQVKDSGIPKETLLDCVDFEEKNSIKVFDTVYDSVYRDYPDKDYDLIMGIGLTDVFTGDRLTEVFSKVKDRAKYIFLDENTKSAISLCIADRKFKPITVGDKNFYLIFK